MGGRYTTIYKRDGGVMSIIRVICRLPGQTSAADAGRHQAFQPRRLRDHQSRTKRSGDPARRAGQRGRGECPVTWREHYEGARHQAVAAVAAMEDLCVFSRPVPRPVEHRVEGKRSRNLGNRSAIPEAGHRRSWASGPATTAADHRRSMPRPKPVVMHQA